MTWFVLGLLVFFVYSVGAYPGSGKTWVRDGDMRALITIVLILGCVVMAVLDMVLRNGSGTIPEWLLGMSGPIVGYFFRDQSAAKDAQRVVDATEKATQTAANVAAQDKSTPQAVNVVNPGDRPVPVDNVGHNSGGGE